MWWKNEFRRQRTRAAFVTYLVTFLVYIDDPCSHRRIGSIYLQEGLWNGGYIFLVCRGPSVGEAGWFGSDVSRKKWAGHQLASPADSTRRLLNKVSHEYSLTDYQYLVVDTILSLPTESISGIRLSSVCLSVRIPYILELILVVNFCRLIHIF